MKRSYRAFAHWFNYKGEPPAIAWTASILWLVLIGWLAFGWKLGSTGLVDETEPLFAEAARQMTVTGDWITPFFNGETRFDKPILIYWLMAIAYKIVGVNSWAVRLPSALSAFGLMGLVFYTLWSFGVVNPNQFESAQGSKTDQTRRYWWCAGLGSALSALNAVTIVWARIGSADLLLTGCMDGALLCFFIGYSQPTKPRLQASWYLVFYVLIALAILTKGPVGIVLPGLIIGAFVLYIGNWREVWHEMRPVMGSFLILALVLPWYVLVIWRNGWAFINSFFGYHNLERFTGVVNHHSQPWYFYFLVVLVGFVPWSIYLPIAIARLKFWQRSHWRSSNRSTQLGLFAWFWFIGVFSFFTIAVTKLPHYVLPLMPAASILVALMWSNLLIKPGGSGEVISSSPASSASSSLVFSGWVNVVFLLALAGVFFWSPHFIGYDPAIVNPRQLIEDSGLPVLGCAIWSITAVAIAILVWYRQWGGVLMMNLLGFLAFVIFVFMPTGLLIDQARQLPLRDLSEIVTKVEQPGEPLVMIGFKKPSVVFYTQRPVKYVLLYTDALTQIKKISVTQPQPPTLLILTQPKKLEAMGLQPNHYQNLGKSGTYQLIRISKSQFQV
ncbi:glycosyltransferase family 39 protein [Aetokthonos hydrillicola Thurmond2011]|jgi:4-amino-4-deoxy-L-arabinose transferase-like glycosyltransferase|uniref:Glycosyltransferase family 39 protein n=1 Tax=Aetokthonos hydrillicola Thurmond2011 TaxID=2712845 RepID=A0AAP5I3G1_9CYAN|nr:glycosyltransferase family 39 protein [Aetokthonos hydrillicola]MBO3458247.1 glycosyltransferase family 39 protein [Aetokthonos hydrillicola CCALA 1050]MBW4586708.1 glycosyltransferase family 39 protein [Aetokthonos hydrillicola CCALA 1050]MDR9893965.1 glycosyltransferase family 39 protein [Aetokthonos hydrillicola Thurmond2011]